MALVVGLAYAWAMHGRRPLPGIHRAWRVLLWTLRTLTIGIVVLLCFDPQWLGMDRQVDAPLIVVALDQSRSMENTGLQPEEVFDFGQQIRQKLGKEYRVEILGFGQDVRSYPGSKPQNRGTLPLSLSAELPPIPMA